MDGGILHNVSNVDFDNYYYFGVMIPNGATAILNGTTLPSMSAPISFDVSVTSASGSGYFLIGRKKPEFMADYNSDGTRAIR